MRFWKTGIIKAKEVEFDKWRDFIRTNKKAYYPNDTCSEIGYEVLGPFLLGFSVYLHKHILKEESERIFFLSRDGWIIKKAYEMIYPEDKSKCEYLLVSRHSVTIPLLSDAQNYDEMLDTVLDFLYIPNLGKMGEVCGVETDAYDVFLRRLGYSLETDIKDVKEKDKQQIFRYVYAEKGDYYVKQKGYLERYLKEKRFEGNIAIVDIGWNGSIQHSLQRHVNTGETNITGYYYGVKNTRPGDYYAKDRRKGFFFEGDSNKQYKQLFRFTAEIMDILYINPLKGTVISYDEHNGRIVACRGEREYGERERQSVSRIQRAAIAFIEDVKKHEMVSEISQDVLMRVYKKFAAYPQKQVLDHFRDFCISDGPMVKKITPEKSWKYYVLHPKQLASEINNNKCKLWFLAGLCSLPLPYYYILNMASEIGMKSELQKRISDLSADKERDKGT